MRVHVISDMEGVGGIVKANQTNAGEPMFEEGRKLYTGEINAAVRGAKGAGATEIVVLDCHGAGGGFTFNSLIAEDLDPACEFVVQEEWTEYTELLTQGYDAALFVGMHAMAGTPDGILNHTVSGGDWQNLWFNGTQVGETGMELTPACSRPRWSTTRSSSPARITSSGVCPSRASPPACRDR